MPEPTLALILGPMFGGKSTELMRRIERAKLAKRNIVVIKPKLDNRYSSNEVVTHSGIKAACEVLPNTLDFESFARLHNGLAGISDIFIDEANFFSGLYPFCFQLMRKSVNIAVSALSGDFRLGLIGETHTLLPLATEIVLLPAVSPLSGADAYYNSYSGPTVDGNIAVGGKECYETLTFGEWVTRNKKSE
jgi:thymidine kinase